eukprot:2985671-Pleurochrysis_carterae.AAC.2
MISQSQVLPRLADAVQSRPIVFAEIHARCSSAPARATPQPPTAARPTTAPFLSCLLPPARAQQRAARTLTAASTSARAACLARPNNCTAGAWQINSHSTGVPSGGCTGAQLTIQKF